MADKKLDALANQGSLSSGMLFLVMDPTNHAMDASGTDLKVTYGTLSSAILSGAITPSLADAKGDLFVGSANDTVIRKPAGADGTLLAYDSSKTGGLDAVQQFRTGTHAARLTASHSTVPQLWKETDTGLIYLDALGAWTVWKGDGFVRKTASQTLTQSSTTLQDVTDLAFPVEPNEVWQVEVFLMLGGASGNADWKFAWTAPSGISGGHWLASDAGGKIGTGTAVDASQSMTPQGRRGFGTAIAIGGGNTTLAPQMLQMFAYVTADSTPGTRTMQLQAAQNTATAENNIIGADSWLRLRRLA